MRIFGCSHKLSRVFSTERDRNMKVNGRLFRHYRVCTDCGEKFAYDWREMKVVA